MKWSWLIAGSNGRPDHELVMTVTCDHFPDWESNTHDHLSSWAERVHMVRGCVVSSLAWQEGSKVSVRPPLSCPLLSWDLPSSMSSSLLLLISPCPSVPPICLSLICTPSLFLDAEQ